MRGSQGLNTSQRLNTSQILNSGRRQSNKLDTPCSSESLIELERLRTENAKLSFMLKEARDQNRHQDELAKAEIALLESKNADLEAKVEDLEAKVEDLGCQIEDMEA